MPNTKKLLSITNLKKYFPVAKTSIFQKNTLYVRANEDITIDIYEGETLGIVGESGCGKSTFGRVLLQLYPQTAGCTLYYGTTLDRLTPSYVEDTIVHHEKYRRKLKKSTEKYEELHKKVEEAGGEDAADFYLLQSEHLAKGEMETDVSNLVKILGGFYPCEDKKGIELLHKQYEACKKRNEAAEKVRLHQVASEHFDQEYQEADPDKKARLEKKLADAREKLSALQKDEAAAQAQVGRARGAVNEVKSYLGETVQTAQMEGEVSSIYPKVGELVGTGSPIMTISMMNDLWGTFNVREDQLNGMNVGTEFTAFIPAFNKDVKMKVYYMKDQGSYAVWKATKANGQYDLKTFEVKARPIEKIEGLRPGMSLIVK